MPDVNASLDQSRGAWWGDLSLSPGDVAHWQIGPYECWLAHAEHEWRFCSRRDDDASERRLAHAIAPNTTMPDTGVVVRRLGLRRIHDRFRLTPMLADRSVMVRPAQPISLPPNQELALFFSSPLWIRVEVDDPLVEFLQEPLQRPSDTWFGPNTREGEVCYSLRTSARLQLAELPQRPHRAVTELHVDNRSRDPLSIDRIRVPLPAMSLHADDDHVLWTQAATYVHHGDKELAELKLGSGPPAHAASAREVCGPRAELPRGNLFSAFGGLIGGL